MVNLSNMADFLTNLTLSWLETPQHKKGPVAPILVKTTEFWFKQT